MWGSSRGNCNTDLVEVKEKLKYLKNATEEANNQSENVKKNIDPFLTLKLHILDVLEETRKCIRERESKQQYQVNSIEAIKKGNIIYNNMKNVDAYFLKLEEILNKQKKQTNVYCEKEIIDKEETISILKKQIYDCKKLSNFDVIRPTTVVDFNDIKNRNPEIVDTHKEVTHDDDDLIIINRWKERDKQFNEEILQIGEVIDRIGQNAENITKQAEQQNEIILNLQHQTEKAHDNVNEASKEIKNVMITQSHATWCCRISLSLALLLLTLLTLSIFSNKFLK